VRKIGGVEVDHRVEALGWRAVGDSLRLVAVRVEEAEAAAGAEVVEHERVQEVGLAHPRICR
jgi:hypothetical protein